MKKIGLLILVVLMLFGCSSKNTLDWALWEQPYAFAVEVDDFNGDNVDAGTYSFSVTNTKLGEAMMYDVYITDFNTDSLSDVLTSGIEPIIVGGANSESIEVQLDAGSYIYCIPVDLAYTPSGVLKIKKIK